MLYHLQRYKKEVFSYSVRKIYQKFCLFFLGLCFVSQCAHAGLVDEADQVAARAAAAQAMQESPVIQDLYNQSQDWRAQEQSELLTLLDAVREKMQDHNPEQLLADLKEALQTDDASFNGLQTALQDQAVGSATGVLWQLKTHKMGLFTTESITWLDKNEGTFLDWITADPGAPLPSGYALEAPQFLVAGEPTTPYGSTRGPILKMLLTRTYALLQGRPTAVEALEGLADIDRSPWLHPVPVPESLAEHIPLFYAFSDVQTPYALTVVHNGYAFGGHRKEDRFPDGKVFGPEDCSSLGTKKCHLPTFSPLHLMLHYYDKAGCPWNHEDVQTSWSGKVSQDWKRDKFYEPLQPFDVVRESCPGDVCAQRGFKAFPEYPAAEDFLWGTGGHVSFFLGHQGVGPDAKIFTMGTNRAHEEESYHDALGHGMEHIFGIETRPGYAVPTEVPLEPEQRAFAHFFLRHKG